MKYRIWNNKEKKYDHNLFLSQDGAKLMKEGWKAVPLTDDFKVEQGVEVVGEGIFFENDIVYYWSYEEVGVLRLDDESVWRVNDERLEDLENLIVAGNTNENSIEEFYVVDEELEKDYQDNLKYEENAGK